MKGLFPVFSVLLLAALLLTHAESASAAVRDSMELCARSVIPSLFPFLAVTALLLHLGLDGMLRPLCAPLMRPLFRMRGECAAPILAGILGGYPAGARAAAQLYEQGRLSRSESERLLGFCNNCGPGFLIGFVGSGVLGSLRAGTALLLIHMLSAVISGMILCRLPGKSEPAALPCRLPTESVSFARALTLSVSSALSSVMSICAYVTLFRTAAALLPTAVPRAVTGALEMVSGLSALPQNSGGFVAAAAIIGWGGISVHCQTMSAVGELRLTYHTVGKFLQALFSALLAMLTAQWVYR